MRNVRASGLRAARSSPSAPTTPIAKHPARFTRNVPAGNAPGAARWTTVARAYRSTEPRPPPANTRTTSPAFMERNGTRWPGSLRGGAVAISGP